MLTVIVLYCEENQLIKTKSCDMQHSLANVSLLFFYFGL